MTQRCSGSQKQFLKCREKIWIVTGSRGFGKQNLFFVLLRGWIEQYGEEVEIYVADFECRLPQTIQKLPQIGGIIYALEEEKLENWLEMMREEIEFRKHQSQWERQENKRKRSLVICVWFPIWNGRKSIPGWKNRLIQFGEKGADLVWIRLCFRKNLEESMPEC